MESVRTGSAQEGCDQCVVSVCDSLCLEKNQVNNPLYVLMHCVFIKEGEYANMCVVRRKISAVARSLQPSLYILSRTKD